MYETNGKIVPRWLDDFLDQRGNEDERDHLQLGEQFGSCGQAIHPRHENVGYDDVRDQADGRLNQFLAIADGSHDLKVFAEELNDGTPHRIVVFRNEHARSSLDGY